MSHLKKSERERLKHLKEYLEGWDFKVEPWFTIPEEDARILLRAIEQYDKSLERRKLRRLRRKEGK